MLHSFLSHRSQLPLGWEIFKNKWTSMLRVLLDARGLGQRNCMAQNKQKVSGKKTTWSKGINLGYFLNSLKYILQKYLSKLSFTIFCIVPNQGPKVCLGSLETFMEIVTILLSSIQGIQHPRVISFSPWWGWNGVWCVGMGLSWPVSLVLYILGDFA